MKTHLSIHWQGLEAGNHHLSPMGDHMDTCACTCRNSVVNICCWDLSTQTCKLTSATQPLHETLPSLPVCVMYWIPVRCSERLSLLWTSVSVYDMALMGTHFLCECIGVLCSMLLSMNGYQQHWMSHIHSHIYQSWGMWMLSILIAHKSFIRYQSRGYFCVPFWNRKVKEDWACRIRWTTDTSGGPRIPLQSTIVTMD